MPPLSSHFSLTVTIACGDINLIEQFKIHLSWNCETDWIPNILELSPQQTNHKISNTLWPSDAINVILALGSTLLHVMAWCCQAPSHFLNRCWLLNSEVLWHSPEGSFTGNAQDIYPWYEIENYWFKITVPSPRGQWVDFYCPSFSILTFKGLMH